MLPCSTASQTTACVRACARFHPLLLPLSCCQCVTLQVTSCQDCHHKQDVGDKMCSIFEKQLACNNLGYITWYDIYCDKYIIEKFVLLLCPTFYNDFILSSIKRIAATDFSRRFCYTAVTGVAAKFLPCCELCWVLEHMEDVPLVQASSISHRLCPVLDSMGTPPITIMYLPNEICMNIVSQLEQAHSNSPTINFPFSLHRLCRLIVWLSNRMESLLQGPHACLGCPGLIAGTDLHAQWRF